MPGCPGRVREISSSDAAVQRLLIDSGPLVALFDKSDAWHAPVTAFVKDYRGQLDTSAANITEAAHCRGK